MHIAKSSVCKLVALMLLVGSAAASETLLVHQPTASATRLAFVSAGDIWVSNLDGSDPHRLTVYPGIESDPHFSPDGRHIAFTGWYGGNYDVFVIPVEGGQPVRLTWHPAPDIARGWSAAGTQVLFTSTRNAFKPSKQFQLWTVDYRGGFPQVLPMPTAFRGTYSPDGKRIAYTPIRDPPFGGWKRYRGGMAPPIWIFDFATQQIEKVEHDRTNDRDPVWVGDKVYFISDRNRIGNVFSYDTQTKAVAQLTHHEDFDVLSATAAGQSIYYEQAGRIRRLDTATGQTAAISVQIQADQPAARPHSVDASKTIEAVALSPEGSQVAFAARGDIHLVAAKSGNSVNLTHSSYGHERNPVWSPDGKRLAWCSDASGEYQLTIYSLENRSERVIPLEKNPSFYFHLAWAPDGRSLVLSNKHNQLLWVDVERAQSREIDRDEYAPSGSGVRARFSPDGRYLAYSLHMSTHMRAIHLYDSQTRQIFALTDGASDSTEPNWSRDGHYLYFLSSEDVGTKTNWLSIGNIGQRSQYTFYVAALGKDTPPRLPATDIAGVIPEKKEPPAPAGKAAKTPPVDFEGLRDRIVSLPIKAGNYGGLAVAPDGSLFYLEFGPDDYPVDMSLDVEPQTLFRFEFDAAETKPLAGGIKGYRLSDDGLVLLTRTDKDWAVRPVSEVEAAGKTAAADARPLDLTGLRAEVDPRQEWRQMYFEAWRVLRDYFYAPNMHGLDWAAVRDRYAPFLEHLGHRADLDFLLREMQGELVVGHAYISPGDQPGAEPVPVGMLGADLALDHGAFRIAKIYRTEAWNAEFKAPLDRSGLEVKEGDYILAVDGRPLDSKSEISSKLAYTVGRETALLVADDAAGKNGRVIYVRPIDYAQETKLRLRDWVEANRRKVDEMSGGKVAYVHLPDTAQWGREYFQRYFYSQLDKQALIVDDRFNDGGYVSDSLVNTLAAPFLSYWVDREGDMMRVPANIFGPRAMIINETAGSGGDALPLYFRRQGLGPLIGTRTWGGLVGIGSYPPLLDGGRITAPHFAILSPEGEWEVENAGVPPDIEVEQTPALVIKGADPQLEKAVAVVMQALQQSPPKFLKKPPPYPDRALQ